MKLSFFVPPELY
jgi:hypothetical protein